MESPQTQPPRLLPFLVLATAFYLVVGAIAYARHYVLESFKQEVVITSLKKEGDTSGPGGGGGGPRGNRNDGPQEGEGNSAPQSDSESSEADAEEETGV